MKIIIIGLMLLFCFNIVLADMETIIICGGDLETQIGCIIEDENHSNIANAYEISITLISPEQGTAHVDGIVRFIFNPSSTNTLTNCSLIYQDEVYSTTNNPIENSNNIIEVIGIDNQHRLYNDDLQWSISCTDIVGNTGYSETRNLDTREDYSSGGISPVGVMSVNILYNTIWEIGENIITIEVFNKNGKLFMPKNITLEIQNESITLSEQIKINTTTIMKLMLDENTKIGIYSIKINITEDTTISRDIEFIVEKEYEIQENIKELSKKLKIRLWIIGIILIIMILALVQAMIILDKKRKKI